MSLILSSSFPFLQLHEGKKGNEKFRGILFFILVYLAGFRYSHFRPGWKRHLYLLDVSMEQQA